MRNFWYPGVTIVMPHIPTRVREYERALRSVARQERQPQEFIVSTDHEHHGATVTRNRGLFSVITEWTAFLDDDDELLPNHIDVLMSNTLDGADVIYTGYDVIGGTDPWQRFGLPFDPDVLRDHSYIPVTSLVRTELARAAGGFQPPPRGHYEDWGFYLKMLEIGAQFKHVPTKTWNWYHWGKGRPGVNGNTSGLGDRW